MDQELKKLQDLLDEVQVVPFKFCFLPMLKDMLEAQEYPDVEDYCMDFLPKIGYIALLNNQPIAAGFLRRVERDILGQIDSLVSNPYFGAQIRHKGLNMVVDQLLYDAKSIGLKGVYALTVDESVLKRAEAIGFSKVNHQVIALSFPKE